MFRLKRLVNSTVHVVLLIVVWLSFGMLGGVIAQEGESYGLPNREPWENTRFVGTPEPQLPYTVESVFTNQVWHAPIFIAPSPSSDHLLALLHESNGKPTELVVFRDEADVSERTQLLELQGRIAYSFCFDPDYANNGQLYLFSNLRMDKFDGNKANRVSRFVVRREPEWSVNPDSEHIIIEWPSRGHDGGGIGFGHNGMLYISTGDGTSDSDKWLSGQTLDDLLGAVLRIDIRESTPEKPYTIPSDNPFVDFSNARPELYAYGLRNPWRLTVDALTGQVWVGNNGQDLWETVNLVRPGENYGWSVYEGSHPFYINRKLGPQPLTLPTAEHPHSEARSITGGVVYYGAKWPDLRGHYIYGDYETGKIWGIKHDGEQVVSHRELADTSLAIAGFATTNTGELLVVDHSGGFYRLTSQPRIRQSAPFPKRLSETGLFADTEAHEMKPGVISYSVIASGWNDGALAKRWMAVPSAERIGYDRDGAWQFPNGTALVQTLSVEREDHRGLERSFRVETRIMVRQQNEWVGYSYRWNKAQTNAELVGPAGAKATFRVADTKAPGRFRRQDWVFPSRADCMVCHSRAGGYTLGITGANMNRNHTYSVVEDNQVRTLSHAGFFRNAPQSQFRRGGALVDPYDTSEDLERRVRSYLHINCAACHIKAGGGNSMMDLGLTTSRRRMRLIEARPQHDTYGIANAMLVSPGVPDQSVLLQRLNRRGRGQMPPLVSGAVDHAAVELFREWIGGMKPTTVFVKNWKMADLGPALSELDGDRALSSGKEAFDKSGCAQCHWFNGRGGSVGPDLTGLAKRMKPLEVLESILEPSRTIADVYSMQQFTMSDGEVHVGQVQDETDTVVRLRSLSATLAPVTLPKVLIVSRKKLGISNMPPGMVNMLTKKQILDLVAYLLK